MSKFGSRVAASMTAAVLAAAPLSAQVIYNNGLPNGAAGNEMTEWIQAEDFTLGSATTVGGVTFWAAVNSNFSGYQGSIVWQIYGNGAGTPGTLMMSGTASPTPTLYPGADITSLGDVGYQLTFALPDIALGAGTYWLGLHNGPLTTADYDGFYWATTDANATATAEEDIYPFGDGWSSNGEEHAFQLDGVAGGAVTPEPDSMALLGMGLVSLTGAGMFRRRRKTA
jgi:hypothetical protein